MAGRRIAVQRAGQAFLADHRHVCHASGQAGSTKSPSIMRGCGEIRSYCRPPRHGTDVFGTRTARPPNCGAGAAASLALELVVADLDVFQRPDWSSYRNPHFSKPARCRRNNRAAASAAAPRAHTPSVQR
jgi:hypothetical protein